MATYTEILQAIHASKADCVWIGLAAAAVYGSNLVSNDFDFFVRPSPIHLDRLRCALRGIGMKESLPDVTSANLIASEATLTFTDPMGGPPVDAMNHISGPSFNEVWKGSVIREVTGVPVRVADLKHIVASKRAANREKDRYALKRLEQDLRRELKEAHKPYRVRRGRRGPSQAVR